MHIDMNVIPDWDYENDAERLDEISYRIFDIFCEEGLSLGQIAAVFSYISTMITMFPFGSKKPPRNNVKKFVPMK